MYGVEVRLGGFIGKLVYANAVQVKGGCSGSERIRLCWNIGFQDYLMADIFGRWVGSELINEPTREGKKLAVSIITEAAEAMCQDSTRNPKLGLAEHTVGPGGDDYISE